MLKPIDLLARLVGVQGITANEEAIVSEAAAVARELGLDPEVSPDGVVFAVSGKAPGPTLLFCSHLDTVPEGEGWTVPAFEATIRDGYLYGRGSTDARAACTAILLASAHLARQGLACGQVIGVLSVGEEGNDPSLPRLLERLDPPDAGIVGEPTQMQIATAQRGLIVLELVASGVQGHAARTEGPNAALTLARDLVFLNELQPPRWHPTLGQVKLTPTRISAGVADNVIPPTAKAMVDVRTTPSYTHAELLDIVSRTVESEVRVLADHWVPCEITPSDPLVAAARQALPEAKTFASSTTSDWVFLEQKGIPAIKVGPGRSRDSHTADEKIAIADLEAGVAGYIRIAETYLTNSRKEK